MSRCGRRMALAAALLIGAGLGAAAIGLMPVAASSGHWAVTAWLLHTTMRRAVQLRALFVPEPPDLEDPALVLRGAGHYAGGCAPCHGAPGQGPSAVTRHMTPAPPVLAPRIDEWTPRELYWIVRHGVKFTGMPAWPAPRREDEPWSVVAFLRRMPDLSGAEYRRLALGDAADQEVSAPASAPGASSAALQRHAETAAPGTAALAPLAGPLGPVIRSCARCHGRDGLGRVPGAFPRLAGQSETYLAASLAAYADGTRHSGIMEPVAAALDAPARQALAVHFSRLPPGRPAGDPAAAAAAAAGLDPPRTAADAAVMIGQGERIARRGVPERKVASCVPCHGPRDGPRNRHYPLLAGQDPAYLVRQLDLFIDDRRGGTGWSGIMEISMHRLTLDESAAVAAYYAGLAR